MKSYHVLYIEKHRSIEQQVLPILQQYYDVAISRGRREALATFAHQVSDLVLINVPSIRFDLARFCDDIKKLNPSIALFFLLNKTTPIETLPRAHGFLEHPITTRQLLNRLSRLLPEQEGEIIAWHGLTLDTVTHSLSWGTAEIFLTPKQAALAAIFLHTPTDTLTRAELMQKIWGTDYLGDTRTLDVHIHWLRKALKGLNAPLQLKTIRGIGYRLIALDALDPEA